MQLAQPGILAPLPRAARYLTFHLKPEANPAPALERLSARHVGGGCVVGLGPALVARLGATLLGLRPFPQHTAAGLEVPSTPAALFLWLRGDDAGALVHETREILGLIGDAFRMDPPVEAFLHAGGKDLTGYVDGTENPKGDDAVVTALVEGRGPGLDGGSFVSVQQWEHDLGHFMALDPGERDLIVGRTAEGDEEIADAPASSHVKRTAQESFAPAAFVVRRSMPWAAGDRAGLMFVSFGRSVDAFEALLSRMVGEEDGITDAVFRFSRPLTGAHFFCPPVLDGRLDLRALGL